MENVRNIKSLRIGALAALVVCVACVVDPGYGGEPVVGPAYAAGYGSYTYPWDFGERVDIANGYGHGGWYRNGGDWHGYAHGGGVRGGGRARGFHGGGHR